MTHCQILALDVMLLVILVIRYGTFILKYLLVEWTDFRFVFWFELNLSRTWFPVNGVLFLSAVFEKLARIHTPILTNSWPVHFVYVHVRPTKQAYLYSIVSPVDLPDNGDCPHIYLVVLVKLFVWHICHFGWSRSLFWSFGTKGSIVNNSAYSNFFPIELHS